MRHMWDVYTNNRRIRLPRFWEKAFEAAYEDLTSDAADVRDVAVAEIVNMSLRSLDLQLPPVCYFSSLLKFPLYCTILILDWIYLSFLYGKTWFEFK